MYEQNLIVGAYDLHVHSAPDVLPRKVSDVELGRRIVTSEMAGYGLKNHFFATNDRAQVLQEMNPDCDFVGGICLNASVGGINPSAAEMAALGGARIIWMPTCNSKHEYDNVFGGSVPSKLPFWARIIISLNEQGIKTPVESAVDKDGKLTEDAAMILKIAKRYNIAVATGHISHQETFELAAESKRIGFEKLIITHATFPSTFYSVEQQKKLIDCGAIIEHCFTTFATGKIDFDVIAEQIKSVGVDHVFISTDLGQQSGVYPDEGMLIFSQKLIQAGFSEIEVRKMNCENPVSLVSKGEKKNCE